MSTCAPRSGTDWEAVAERMAAGELSAYQQFAVVFGEYLRRYFLKKKTGDAAAEELAVSCVSDIALKIKKYQATGNFEGWVFTIARNRWVDWLRSQDQSIPLHDNLSSEALDNDVQPDINKICAVHEAVAQLPKNDQEIIQLRDLGPQYTYEEIAGRLGIAIGTARVRHLRALERLEAILKKDPRIKLLGPNNNKPNDERLGAD